MSTTTKVAIAGAGLLLLYFLIKKPQSQNQTKQRPSGGGSIDVNKIADDVTQLGKGIIELIGKKSDGGTIGGSGTSDNSGGGSADATQDQANADQTINAAGDTLSNVEL